MNVIRINSLVKTPVNSGMLGVSQSTVWRWVKLGIFPQPFKIGVNTTVWDADEINAWLTKQADKTTTHQK